MNDKIMISNQGVHVTLVWTWRLSKQRLSFFRTFHPFIQHHDVDAVAGRTPWDPMSHFLNRRVGMGCQAFRLQANYVFKISRMHAYLQIVHHI